MLDQADDRARILDALASAFAADPVARWLWPNDDDYAAHIREFAGSLVGDAIGAGTAWQLEDYAAVAAWLPPGVEPDPERIGAALKNGVTPEIHQDMFAILEQMEEIHPRYPHWYLPWIGVQPTQQGNGLGETLLSRCLEHVDIDGLPVFLEASNPRLVPLFERHGFDVIGSAQSGSCPPVALMLRPGRAAAARS